MKISEIVIGEIHEAQRHIRTRLAGTDVTIPGQANFLQEAAGFLVGVHAAWGVLRDAGLLTKEADAEHLLQALRYVKAARVTASLLHQDDAAAGLDRVRMTIAKAYEKATPYGPPQPSGNSAGGIAGANSSE